MVCAEYIRYKAQAQVALEAQELDPINACDTQADLTRGAMSGG